jgi:predicted dehydrogenase
MKENRIRFAVVGLGHISQVACLPAFKKRDLNAELKALVSGTESKLNKLAKMYRVKSTYNYSEYNDMLESGEVDAVYIGLPNALHHDFAMRAIERGVHVLCEKPLCPTARECEELIEAAENSGVKLMTAYRLHFDPANLKVIELLGKNRIGEPMTFNSLFSFQIKEENFRLRRKMAGGAAFDIGIYCINAARYIFREEPRAVFGNLVNSQDKRFQEVDGTINATLLFSGGKSAIFTASFAVFERSFYEIVGSKGSIRVEPAYEYAEGLSFILQTEKGKKAYKFKKHDQFAAELDYFSNCIAHDRKIEPDGREGLADVRIIEALKESSRLGKLIELSPFETDYPSPKQRIERKPHPEPDLVGNVQSASH